MVIDKFSKMEHFTPYHEIDDTNNIVDLLFSKIVHFMGFREQLLVIEMLSSLTTFERF